VLGVEALLRVVLVVGLVVSVTPGVGLLATVVGAAALGSALVGLLGARGGGLRVDGGALALLRSMGVLITGAAALQTLLYGGLLVARVLAPAGQEVVAGQLLAAITVTRIPVFLFQSLQALVVPRIAERARHGDAAALLVAVRRLLVFVGALGVATALGSAAIGPVAVGLMFGEGYVVSHSVMGLLGLGTGVFMFAVALSDINVALGGHRLMASAWVVGLLAAVLSVFLLSDFILQVTVPLVVGSAVAAGLLVWGARVRLADFRSGPV
jgi:O-antigen/teichoic acid export membrane protein